MNDITEEQISDAIGTEQFGDLLIQYLYARYYDLDFVDLGGNYADEVEFELAGEPEESEYCATVRVLISYDEVRPTTCPDIAFRKPHSLTARVTVYRDGHGVEIDDHDDWTHGDLDYV